MDLFRSGSDNERAHEAGKSPNTKPLFDVSLKRFEKNKQIKHLSENIVEDDNKEGRRLNKNTNVSSNNNGNNGNFSSKTGGKMNLKSGGNFFC